MKTNSVPFVCGPRLGLLLTLVLAQGAALAEGPAAQTAAKPARVWAWWRLAEKTPPLLTVDGGPQLEWWAGGRKESYVSSPMVPPAGLYRGPYAPPALAFDSGQSYRDALGILKAKWPVDSDELAGGLTVEGFFKTPRSEKAPENQALVTCGDGWMDARWAVRLLEGRLACALFESGKDKPALELTLAPDLRDDNWHYFAARILPRTGFDPARLSLAVVTATGTVRKEVAVPAGLVLRTQSKPLGIGRSSAYLDNSPQYRAQWNTFRGLLCDVRISQGALPENELLGALQP